MSFVKSFSALYSLCALFWGHKEKHWILRIPTLIQWHVLVTVGLKQWNYSWGSHLKCNSMRNQEKGEALVVFIISVKGSDLQFPIEKAKLPTCLGRADVSVCQDRGAPGDHALPFLTGAVPPRLGWAGSQGQGEVKQGPDAWWWWMAAVRALLQKPSSLKRVRSERWVCFFH